VTLLYDGRFKGKRLLWQGASPWAKTGYGTQAQLWLPLFEERMGLDVFSGAVAGVQGRTSEWDGIQIFPSDLSGNALIHLMRIAHPDLIITFQDVWVLNAIALRGIPNIASWIPIDCEPLSERDKFVLQNSAIKPIAMSKHGVRMLHDEGFDCQHVPHACDTELFKPMPDIAYDDGIWRFGINATNIDPYRKGLSEMIGAFERFHADVPNSALLLHTARETASGINIPNLIRKSRGIQASTVLPSEYEYHAGVYENEWMAKWYNACDAIGCCSYAEGFGLPIIEAMACGKPVLGTDCSAMRELLPTKWKVSGSRWWVNTHQAWWKRPNEDEIVEKLHELYNRSQEEVSIDAKMARAFVVDNYSVPHVWENYWAPTLEELLS
jgi:glycosyltransferase involved in cell wall biosynthesis